MILLIYYNYDVTGSGEVLRNCTPNCRKIYIQLFSTVSSDGTSLWSDWLTSPKCQPYWSFVPRPFIGTPESDRHILVPYNTINYSSKMVKCVSLSDSRIATDELVANCDHRVKRSIFFNRFVCSSFENLNEQCYQRKA